MDVSTPPSLDLACPQAKAELENNGHMIWEGEVDKKITNMRASWKLT